MPNLPLMEDQIFKFNSPLFFAVIIMMLVTIVLTVYHFIFVGWCNCHQPLGIPEHSQLLPPENQRVSGLDDYVIQLIPTHRITKEEASIAGNDSTCAVCLGEFKEGEEVRQLPVCLHLFHVLCIDMWFYSHSSCPLCRTDMTPPAPLRQEITLDISS